MTQMLKTLEDILSAVAFTDAGEYAKALEMLVCSRSLSQEASPS
ncbi:MAG: hypothetical protein M0024_10890 [Nitrospiraceae bacterium]|nr:hypothetical protein [Nitrospiraceae bacterium]